jgi:nucleoside-diphosphate-sugar epimerase
MVTGARGVLGHAVRAVTATERQLVLLDQRPESYGVTQDGTEVVIADIRQPDSYRRHLRGASAVVHLASLHGRDHMSRFGATDFWSVNVDGTRMLYDPAAEAGVGHIVLASSMAVYGPIPRAPQRDWVRCTEQTPTISHDPYRNDDSGYEPLRWHRWGVAETLISAVKNPHAGDPLPPRGPPQSVGPACGSLDIC